MTRYYYDKYKTEYKCGNYRNPDDVFTYVKTTEYKYLDDNQSIHLHGYNNYGFNSTSGFYNSGSSITYNKSNVYNGKTRYRANGYYVYKYEVVDAKTQCDVLVYRENMYEKKCEYDSWYLRGSYIATEIAEDGTYPNNGRHIDGYWYVKTHLAFPKLTIKKDDFQKLAYNGWVKIDEQLREIESIKIKINNIIKDI